jgi:hypothetical protein
MAAKKKAAIPGRRVGTKRRDMRWEAPDGTVWDSRFEFEVFSGFKARGVSVSRLEAPKDSLDYTSPVRGAECTKCGADKVVQRRTITFDLLAVQKAGSGSERRSYRVEAKGYLRAPRRRLLRCFRQAWPSADLRLVFQADYKVGKGTVLEWCAKYLKCPAFVWKGPESIPEGWII